MKTIFLISCVKSKLDKPAPAKDLYTSSLFKGYLRYVAKTKNKKKLPLPATTYILSAKYGLVELDQIIEPYDLTLLKMTRAEVKEWAETKVLPKLREVANLKEDLFIFLAGNRYRQFLVPQIKHHHIPFIGLPIGKQLQALKKLC